MDQKVDVKNVRLISVRDVLSAHLCAVGVLVDIACS